MHTCAVISGFSEVLSRGALKPDGQEDHGPDRTGAGVRTVLAGAQTLPYSLGEENAECCGPAVR